MNYFFVGTAAELIKLAPVIREAKRRALPTFLVASGQNDLAGSELWSLAGAQGADLVLHTAKIPPRASGLALFLARAAVTGLADLRRTLALHRAPSPRAIVHGDTVSTLLGATLFASLGVPVHHVEAGLRSFRYAEPFPEELCRVLVSRLASVAYCPNDWASQNLASLSLRRVVTGGNTLYDALALALASDEPPPAVLDEVREPYFVLVLHRQENLVGGGFLRAVLDEVRRAVGARRCLFVMHALTRAALEREGLMRGIERDPRFVLLPRQPYVAFTRVLAGADFVVTDGGSNQEEAYYLGKPCLLLRRFTERTEGLGENVLLSRDLLGEIAGFMRDPGRFRRPPVKLDASPSARIADDLARP
jgi:UDP-N-acetylglucosamine 2-epimerase (non-hydrolysing)